MKNKIILTCIIYLSLYFTSCTKEIKYNGGDTKSFLVVNGIIEGDSTIKISLSKSIPAIGEQNLGSNDIISGASLILTDVTSGEIFNSNIPNTDNFYEFSTKSKKEHLYSISINHPDYGNTTSSTSIPQTVPISSWDSTSINSTNSGKKPGNGQLSSQNSTRTKTVNITISDTDGDNFYIIKVIAIDTILHQEETLRIKTTDASELVGEHSSDALYFNDNLFNNNSKTFDISFRESTLFDQITNLKTGEKSYRIELYNTSKEVFNYLLSVTKAASSNNNPFSEPVKVYTNITNGLGVFGGMSSSSVFIK